MRGILFLSFTFQPGVFQEFGKIPLTITLRYSRNGLRITLWSGAEPVAGFSRQSRMSA